MSGGATGDPVRVRAAVPDDLDAVVALETEGLGDDAWSPVLIAPGLAGELPTVVYRVAESGEVVVGHLVVSVVAGTAELQRVAVAEAHRRRGVASLLVEDAVRLAAEGGAERLLLEVREGNAPAIALYARHGFTEIARRRGYYRGGATAVVMERLIGS